VASVNGIIIGHALDVMGASRVVNTRQASCTASCHCGFRTTVRGFQESSAWPEGFLLVLYTSV
jgi:hypothetical protein